MTIFHSNYFTDCTNHESHQHFYYMTLLYIMWLFVEECFLKFHCFWMHRAVVMIYTNKYSWHTLNKSQSYEFFWWTQMSWKTLCNKKKYGKKNRIFRSILRCVTFLLVVSLVSILLQVFCRIIHPKKICFDSCTVGVTYIFQILICNRSNTRTLSVVLKTISLSVSQIQLSCATHILVCAWPSIQR